MVLVQKSRLSALAHKGLLNGLRHMDTGIIHPGSKSIGTPSSSLKIYQFIQHPHHAELNEGHLLHLPFSAAGSVHRTQSSLSVVTAECPRHALSAALSISLRDTHALFQT